MNKIIEFLNKTRTHIARRGRALPAAILLGWLTASLLLFTAGTSLRPLFQTDSLAAEIEFEIDDSGEDSGAGDGGSDDSISSGDTDAQDDDGSEGLTIDDGSAGEGEGSGEDEDDDDDDEGNSGVGTTSDSADDGSTSTGSDPAQDAWPAEGIVLCLPVPGADMETLFISTLDDNQFDSRIEIAEEAFYQYVDDCKNYGGFTVEETLQTSGEEDAPTAVFTAFDSEGNKLQLKYQGTDDETGTMHISLKAPIPLGTLKWPDYALGLVIPRPSTTVGRVGGSPETFLVSYLGEMPLDSYQEYVDACREAGFNSSVSETDTTFYAENEYGIQLTLEYYGNSVTYLRLLDSQQSWRTMGLGGDAADDPDDGSGLVDPDDGSDGTDLAGGNGDSETGSVSGGQTGGEGSSTASESGSSGSGKTTSSTTQTTSGSTGSTSSGKSTSSTKTTSGSTGSTSSGKSTSSTKTTSGSTSSGKTSSTTSKSSGSSGTTSGSSSTTNSTGSSGTTSGTSKSTGSSNTTSGTTRSTGSGSTSKTSGSTSTTRTTGSSSTNRTTGTTRTTGSTSTTRTTGTNRTTGSGSTSRTAGSNSTTRTTADGSSSSLASRNAEQNTGSSLSSSRKKAYVLSDQAAEKLRDNLNAKDSLTTAGPNDPELLTDSDVASSLNSADSARTASALKGVDVTASTPQNRARAAATVLFSACIVAAGAIAKKRAFARSLR